MVLCGDHIAIPGTFRVITSLRRPIVGSCVATPGAFRVITSLRRPPCVKGAPAERVGDCF